MIQISFLGIPGFLGILDFRDIQKQLQITKNRFNLLWNLVQNNLELLELYEKITSSQGKSETGIAQDTLIHLLSLRKYGNSVFKT